MGIEFPGAVLLVIQCRRVNIFKDRLPGVEWEMILWYGSPSLSAQVSSSHISGTLGISATSGLAIGLVAGLAKS